MKWGLVLAGGGTRGAYHIGVCKAIKEMGIDVGCVTGTSIGAVNGAMFVQGDLDAAEAMWRSIKASDVFDFADRGEDTNLLDAKSLMKIADELVKKNYLNTEPLDRLVGGMLNEEKIRRSGIDFGMTVISLEDRREKRCFLADIPEGELTSYILASACFAGFRPKLIRKSRYIDAGILNNMPTDMILSRGIRNIIEVDVGGPGREKRVCRADKNIISIKANEPVVGIFEFDTQKLRDSITLGYLDAMKAFGALCGKRYYFAAQDYWAAHKRYSQSVLEGIEYAAQILDIERLRIYSVEELSQRVRRAAERIKGRTAVTRKQHELIKKLRHYRCRSGNIYRASGEKSMTSLGAGAIIYLYSEEQGI